MKTKILTMILLWAFSTVLVSCGEKLEEQRALELMQQIFQARKQNNFNKEFALYAKDDFKIVPFDEVKSSVTTGISLSGRFILAKHIKTKMSRRNQLGQGLVKYMIITYEASYSTRTLTESYYFLADSEQAKLVYVTMQL